METSAWQLISSTQYALPVGVVLILAVLVFALGFKNVEPPTLAFLDEERKQAVKKPRKQKEKRETSESEKSNDKRDRAAEKRDKEKKVVEKKPERAEKKAAADNKSVESNKAAAQKGGNKAAVKLAEEIKNRKNEKNLKKLRQPDEKPVDFDDGNWVQALSRKDKKKVVKKDEELSPGKARRKAEREAKRIAAEMQAKAVKEEENTQQQQALQQKQEVQEPTPEPEPMQPEDDTEEREMAKKRNRKNNKKSSPAPEPELIIQVEKQPGPIAAEKKNSISKPPPELAEIVDSNVAFDELGDAWEKPITKKSKKKVRKE